MYLHHILKRPKEEVIRKFYTAQKLKPSRNDWVMSIQNDKNELEIKLSDEEIEKYTKYKFKKYLEDNIKKQTFKYLIKKKENHSKASDLSYDTHKVQNYFKTNNNKFKAFSGQVN